MKPLFILTALFACSFSIAQTVNIPDVNFKNVLLNHTPTIDINGDGEIQVSEAENYSFYISAQDQGINSIEGIEAFINVTDINLGLNNISEVDLSQNVALQEISFSLNPLSELDLSNNLNLKTLFLNECVNITALDVSNNTALEFLQIRETPITSMDLTNNTSLTWFDAFFSNLSSLNTTGLSSLLYLNVHGNQFTVIDVTDLTNLEHLTVTSNQLHEIDITENLNLKSLSISDNFITEIDLSQHLALERLYFNRADVTSLDVTNNINLISISIWETNISNIDLSNNPLLFLVDFENSAMQRLDLSNNMQLTKVEGANNAQLRTLNIKNGANSSIETLDLTNCPVLEFVCVDNIDYASTNFTNVPATAVFIENCTLGSSEYDFEEISVYPNPTFNVVNIQTNLEIDTIGVYNLLGQKIIFKKISSVSYQLDTSTLSSGTYFIKIKSGNSEHMIQIVKK